MAKKNNPLLKTALGYGIGAEHLVGSHIDHGFYGENHAGHEQHASSFGVIMVNFRVFMEVVSRTMSGKITYNREAVFPSMLLDCFADFPDEVPGLCGLNADFQAFLGAVDEPLYAGFDFSDAEHSRCVGKITVLDGRDINVYDVAIPKFLFVRRYAVTHHFVDACATMFRETFVVQRCADGSMTFGEFGNEAVNFAGCHAFTNLFLNHIEDGCVDFSRASDALYLFGCLDQVACRHQTALVLELHDAQIEWSGLHTLWQCPVFSFLAHDAECCRVLQNTCRKSVDFME